MERLQRSGHLRRSSSKETRGDTPQGTGRTPGKWLLRGTRQAPEKALGGACGASLLRRSGGGEVF